MTTYPTSVKRGTGLPMDLHHSPAAPGGALSGRVQGLENELIAAHETIRRLRQQAQEAEQTVQRTQEQMMLYAADLHQMYVQERGRMADLEGAVLDLLMGLVHIVEARDPYTGSHTARVARYARAIATVLGWNEDQLATLELGAQLHDVGKIGIADEILRKPGPLTRAEYRAMQTHVVIGLRILGGVRVLGSIMPFVAYHHERVDGKGYPFGLAGAAIPLEGRLLAVAELGVALHRPALVGGQRAGLAEDRVGDADLAHVVHRGSHAYQLGFGRRPSGGASQDFAK